MYICICHGVTDRDIQKAAKNGVSCLRQLGDTLKVGTCCGACADQAQEYLNKNLGDSLGLENALPP